MHPRLALVLAPIAVAAAARAARADDCGPAVALHGDPEAIGVIGELLAARGIAIDPPACPAVGATVTRRGDALAIEVTPQGGAAIEREASEASTAATVIESFVRADVGSPLLATRPVPAQPQPLPPRAADPLATHAAAPLAPAARGVHVFGAFETSFTRGGTVSLGAHVGACVMLGPVCAALRLRHAAVTAGPRVWDEYGRQTTELLFGIDVPFALGRMVFSPGFAAGLGHTSTRIPGDYPKAETGGLRADVHATLSIPLARRFAVDVFAAGDLQQQTDLDSPDMVDVRDLPPVPAEPHFQLRLGLGLRYGGL